MLSVFISFLFICKKGRQEAMNFLKWLVKPNLQKLESKKDINGLSKALKPKDVEVQLASLKTLVEIGDVNVPEARPFTEWPNPTWLSS